MLRLGLAGPGRVGRTFAALLPADEYLVGPVLSRTFISARRAVREMKRGRPARDWADFEQCDAVLLTPPENVLDDVAAEAGGSTLAIERIVWLHSAGRLEGPWADEWRARGAAVGSIFPLQMLPRQAARLAGVHFTLSGDGPAVALARRMVRSMGGEYVATPPEMRPQAAVAVSAASHVLTAVLELAVRHLRTAGFSRKRAVEALRPICQAAFDEYFRAGGRGRGTGFAEGDSALLERRLAAAPNLAGRDARLYRQALAWAMETLRNDWEIADPLDDPGPSRRG